MDDEVVEQLKELNATTRKLLEVQGLEFALEPRRYIARKLRSGEGIADVGFYYQEIAPGATFTVSFTNPAGYVWVGIMERLMVSQNGVFELTRYLDDAILPWVYIARVPTLEISWSEVLPFGFVKKEVATISYTNHDAVAQWIIGSYLGIFLRKDIWERDSKLMDMAAERYIHPSPEPMPPP